MIHDIDRVNFCVRCRAHSCEFANLPWHGREFLGETSSTSTRRIERLDVPTMLVGGHDQTGDTSSWIEVEPSALKWWEKLPLEPYAHKKNVHYITLCASSDGNAGAEALAAEMFMTELSSVYQAMHLGSHVPLSSKYCSTSKNNSIILVSSLEDVRPGNLSARSTAASAACSFTEAAAKAFKGFTQFFHDLTLQQKGDMPGYDQPGIIPVIYVLEPDIPLGEQWGGSAIPQGQTPPKVRFAWQRALALALGQAASQHPRLLETVLHFVTAQCMGHGRKLRAILQEVAGSVYTKARVRTVATHKPHPAAKGIESGTATLNRETQHYFSGDVITMMHQVRRPS
jgi:hypothetical protein